MPWGRWVLLGREQPALQGGCLWKDPSTNCLLMGSPTSMAIRHFSRSPCSSIHIRELIIQLLLLENTSAKQRSLQFLLTTLLQHVIQCPAAAEVQHLPLIMFFCEPPHIKTPAKPTHPPVESLCHSGLWEPGRAQTSREDCCYHRAEKHTQGKGDVRCGHVITHFLLSTSMEELVKKTRKVT